MPISSLNFDGQFGLAIAARYLTSMQRPAQRSKIHREIGLLIETRLFELKAKPQEATLCELAALNAALAQKPQDFPAYAQSAAREALDALLIEFPPYTDTNRALMLSPKATMGLATVARL